MDEASGVPRKKNPPKTERIGQQTHCASFNSRLSEATLDASLASSLRSTCGGGGDSATAPFDQTSTNFDGVYFRELQQRRGLLSSDQTLFESAETRRLVNLFAMDEDLFYDWFEQGMIKMGQLDVKEGAQGEVRKSCSVINSN